MSSTSLSPSAEAANIFMSSTSSKNMVSNTRTLDQFPTELLEEIFSHVDYISLNSNVRLGCKRFDAIFQNARVGNLGQTLLRVKQSADETTLTGDEENSPNYAGYCYDIHPCISKLQIRCNPSKPKEPAGINDVGFVHPISGIFTPITSTIFANEYAISRPVYKKSYLKIHKDSDTPFINTLHLLKESMKVTDLIACFLQHTRDEFISQKTVFPASVANGFCSLMNIMNLRTRGHRWETGGMLYPFYQQNDMFDVPSPDAPVPSQSSIRQRSQSYGSDQRVWIICGAGQPVPPDRYIKRKPTIGWVRWLSYIWNGDFWKLFKDNV